MGKFFNDDDIFLALQAGKMKNNVNMQKEYVDIMS